MPRFVILQHVTPPESERGTHYDLMLEQDGKLLTWAITEPPRAGLRIAATKLADHRPAYLDYEGPISGNRGEVTRVDAGDYLCSEMNDERARFELWSGGGKLAADLQHETGNQWTAEFDAVE